MHARRETRAFCTERWTPNAFLAQGLKRNPEKNKGCDDVVLSSHASTIKMHGGGGGGEEKQPVSLFKKKNSIMSESHAGTPSKEQKESLERDWWRSEETAGRRTEDDKSVLGREETREGDRMFQKSLLKRAIPWKKGKREKQDRWKEKEGETSEVDPGFLLLKSLEARQEVVGMHATERWTTWREAKRKNSQRENRNLRKAERIQTTRQRNRETDRWRERERERETRKREIKRQEEEERFS